MRTRTTAVLALAVAIFLSACNRNMINLDFTNAKGEVPQLGNLIFRFSKSVMADSLLNVWDSTDYIAFEPKIPGKFRWESPDQLVFSPSQPLSPATSYTASIRNEVLRYSKYDKIKGADKISFHTPDLTLDNTQVMWVLLDETTRSTIPQLNLYFNYSVNPASLRDKLNVEIDNKKAEYTLITASPDSKIALRINGLKTES